MRLYFFLNPIHCSSVCSSSSFIFPSGSNPIFLHNLPHLLNDPLLDLLSYLNDTTYRTSSASSKTSSIDLNNSVLYLLNNLNNLLPMQEH